MLQILFQLFRPRVWKRFCIVSYQFATWEQKGGNEELLSQSATRTHNLILILEGYIHKCCWFFFCQTQRKQGKGVMSSEHLVSVSNFPAFLKVIIHQFIGPRKNKWYDRVAKMNHYVPLLAPIVFWTTVGSNYNFTLNTSGFSCSLFRKQMNRDTVVYIVVGR